MNTVRQICKKRARKLEKRGEMVEYDYTNNCWLWFMQYKYVHGWTQGMADRRHIATGILEYFNTSSKRWYRIEGDGTRCVGFSPELGMGYSEKWNSKSDTPYEDCRRYHLITHKKGQLK